MWLNAFEMGKKPLSPIELLVLTSVPEENTSSNQILELLANRTLEWNQKPGTVYPVLHRLVNYGLLTKNRDRRIHFRRTDKGTIYLSSILKPLKVQIKETNNYYKRIIKTLLTNNPVPIGLHQFLEEIEEMYTDLTSILGKFIEEAVDLKDDSHDVPITFE